MSVVILNRQPSPTGWSGIQKMHTNGTSMYPIDGRPLTWVTTINPLRAYRLEVRTLANAQGPYTVTIQGRVYTLTPGAWRTTTHTVDPDRPLSVSIEGTTLVAATITLVCTDYTLPVRPRPCDVLALDAYLPIPTDAMKWDQSRWDRAAWDSQTPAPGTLIWDRENWDTTVWHDPADVARWQSIIGPCTQITARRGITPSGPILKAEVGTLTITATQDLDPRGIGLTVGTPIRLHQWTTQAPIWTGQVSEVKIEPIKTGGATVTIVAVDAVAHLAAITRYGARPDRGGTETWRQRLARLMTSAPQIHVSVPTSSDTPVCSTVWETSLASHLDALIATTGGAWYADRTGGLVATAALPDHAPALILTDTHADDTDDTAVWHYTDGPAAWSTASLIAGIDATTHDATINADTGEWVAADTKTTVTDPTVTAAWGGTTVAVDMVTPSTGTALKDAATRLLRRATTAPLMTTARVHHNTSMIPDPQTHMTQAATLDPLTPVTAIQRAEKGSTLIAAVTHDITPTTWITDLTLTTAERTNENE